MQDLTPAFPLRALTGRIEQTANHRTYPTRLVSFVIDGILELTRMFSCQLSCKLRLTIQIWENSEQ